MADVLGDSLGCDDGQSDTEGFIEGCELGAVDVDGTSDGCELGCEEGWEDGQSLTDGFMDGCELGAADVLGDSEGCELGALDVEGLKDGSLLAMITPTAMSEGTEVPDSMVTTMIPPELASLSTSSLDPTS